MEPDATLTVRCSICKREWNNLFDGNNVCTPCIKRITAAAELSGQHRDQQAKLPPGRRGRGD